MGHQGHFTQHPQIIDPVHKDFRPSSPLVTECNTLILFQALLQLGIASGKLFPGTREVGEDTLFPQTPIGMGSFLHQKLLLSWSSKDEVHACQDIVCAYLNNFWYIL